MFGWTLWGGNRSINALKTDKHYPASNTVATKTIAAVPNAKHCLNKIVWSYSADPTGGRLTVEDGSANIVFDIDITKGGPGPINFPPRIMSENTAMIITLAAGGVGITGKLQFDYNTEFFP